MLQQCDACLLHLKRCQTIAPHALAQSVMLVLVLPRPLRPLKHNDWYRNVDVSFVYITAKG
jgi:hypothetical protein